MSRAIERVRLCANCRRPDLGASFSSAIGRRCKSIKEQSRCTNDCASCIGGCIDPLKCLVRSHLFSVYRIFIARIVTLISNASITELYDVLDASFESSTEELRAEPVPYEPPLLSGQLQVCLARCAAASPCRKRRKEMGLLPLDETGSTPHNTTAAQRRARI